MPHRKYIRLQYGDSSCRISYQILAHTSGETQNNARNRQALVELLYPISMIRIAAPSLETTVASGIIARKFFTMVYQEQATLCLISIQFRKIIYESMKETKLKSYFAWYDTPKRIVSCSTITAQNFHWKKFRKNNTKNYMSKIKLGQLLYYAPVRSNIWT